MANLTTSPRRGIRRAGIGAAAAALGALTALGAAQPADAATTATARVPTTYTQNFAGYVAANVTFRFVTSTLQVPACLPGAVADTGVAEIDLQGGGPGTDVGAELTVHCGGGRGSVGYVDANADHEKGVAGKFTLSPRIGDVLAISVYYNQGRHDDQFTVTDASQRVTRAVTETVGFQLYTAALAGADFPGSFDWRPVGGTRVWEFTGTHITTESGQHGSVIGPWGTWQSVDRVHGIGGGAVIADAPVLWNRGQNFGVWLHARS